MTKTPFYELPLVSEIEPHSYSPDHMAMGDCRVCGHDRDHWSHQGRTPTGRFPRQPEFQDLQPYQRHTLDRLESEGRNVRYAKVPAASLLAQIDYARMETRIMAQVADSMGLKRIDHETFACGSPEDFERIGSALQETMTNAMAFWYASLAVDRFFTDIDEEGCGAVFAALKSWPDD